MRLISWNVNGIRAAYKKGLLDYLEKDSPDIFCAQEIKAVPEQIPASLKEIRNYHFYSSSAEKKGYSGVAVWTNIKPLKVSHEFSLDKKEGRLLRLDFEDFILFNIYFPNGKASPGRLKYKMDFYAAFLKEIIKLEKSGKNIIFCGDVNTAHAEIDLARPKENEKISGFLKMEREWIDCVIENKFIDAFRYFNKSPHQYTWWDIKTRARERNVGWRIDYFFISQSLEKKLTSAFILPKILGSDHCPIGIEIKI